MEFRCYVPGGIPGYGFSAAALDAALEWRPEALVSQGTSTDIGPWYLGTSTPFVSVEAEEQDLDLIIVGAQRAKIPFIVSVGGSGNDKQLALAATSLGRIAKRRRLHLKVAIVSGEIDREYLRRRIGSGTSIPSIAGSPRISGDLDEGLLDRVECVVAQSGPEVVQHALGLGVDGVLLGRSLDAGLVAAIPLSRGFDVGLSYGFGTLLNDAGAAATPFIVDGLFGVLRDDHFDLVPPVDEERCTPQSVMAAAMRERENPFEESNPGGRLDFRNLAISQLDDGRSARVTGFSWRPESYRVKLEGVSRIGYRTIVIAGFRDPTNIANYEHLLGHARAKVEQFLGLHADSYRLDFISYGIDGVLGPRSSFQHRRPDEVGLVADIVAETQAIATSVARLLRATLLHTGYEGRKSTEGNVAFPFAPTEIEVGAVFEWTVWHALPLIDPIEPFAVRVEKFVPR